MYKLQQIIRNNLIYILIVIAATAVADFRLFKTIIGLIVLIGIPVLLISVLIRMRTTRLMRGAVKKPPETSKLPVIAIMQQSFWLVKNQYRNYIKIFLPHLALFVFALLFLMYRGVFYLLFLKQNPDLGTFLYAVAFLYTYSAAAITWHRFILLNETVDYEESFLHSYKENFKYLGILLCIIWAMDIPTFLTDVVRMIIERIGLINTPVILLASLVFSFIALMIFSRISLILPALALGKKDIIIDDIWSVTSLNKARLLGLFILSGLLLWLPILLFSMLGFGYNFLFYSIFIISTMLLAPFYLTCLSLFYKHFFENTKADDLSYNINTHH